ncbi:hypothetical protein I6F14_35010 [Bradyrhizobium sp. IC3069]|uniref:dCTP deaminase domain-containing protein n=1 Tax=unclassified Bradyrhizobium TaxID=2631580 RepID=UPI001CD62754|nr:MULTISPECIES: hypothetical protein [unclassified Bradyrhizobium]MCA1365452.1 hypothetical protein [Bradyrhizobium sp. IC4059]MCA1523149.1 hypothetical protein [Bradyrhizobium sp. IC3069]
MANIATKRAEQKARIDKYPPLEDDPKPGEHGILLSDQITYFATHHHMIEPFDARNLKPAGYELTVGDEYFMSGEFLDLTDTLTILPFEVAVIKTGEILRLPRFMIARWNIRVTHAYEGLLWVGGPQVDPGYSGHLFCPIYNLSDKPVTLSRGETLALMDFQRTTVFDKRKTEEELKRYPHPPRRLILQDYDIRDFQSALFTRAGRKIEEFGESIRNLETRFITFTQISFAMFAIFLTLLTIYTKVGLNLIETSASLVGSGLVALSVMTFLMAGFTHLQYRLTRLIPDRYGAMMSKRAIEARRFLRFYWLWGFYAMLIVSIAIGALVYTVVDPYFEMIRKNVVGDASHAPSIPVQQIEGRLVAAESAAQQARAEIERLKSEVDTLRGAARTDR